MFPKSKFERVFWITVDVPEPVDVVGLDPIVFVPSKRLTLLSSSSVSSSSLLALNLLVASEEVGAWETLRKSSSRFRATNFIFFNVGVVLLHPGTGGRRLEGLSPSALSNSIAAGPGMMGAASSTSSELETAGRLPTGRSQGRVDTNFDRETMVPHEFLSIAFDTSAPCIVEPRKVFSTTSPWPL